MSSEKKTPAAAGRSPDRVIVFDTTLRDGEQSPGFSMNRQGAQPGGTTGR